MTKYNLWERVYFSLYSHKITHQPDKSLKARTTEEYCLLAQICMAFSGCSHISSRITSPGGVPPSVSWALLPQTSIKIMFHRWPTVPSDLENFPLPKWLQIISVWQWSSVTSIHSINTDASFSHVVHQPSIVCHSIFAHSSIDSQLHWSMVLLWWMVHSKWEYTLLT